MAADAAFSPDPSADEILRAVRAAYASCATYRDRGEVTTTVFKPLQRVIRRPFSTVFDRSKSGFRFEFRSRRGEQHWDQMVVWNDCDGATARPRKWWSARTEEEPIESLAHGIAAATGVSGGSAHRVPTLLMPELIDGGTGLDGSVGATVIEQPEAAAEGCVVIERARGIGAVEQFWIDRTTCLIRRVVVPRFVLESAFPEAIARARANTGRPHREGKTEVAEVTMYLDAVFDMPVASNDLSVHPADTLNASQG